MIDVYNFSFFLFFLGCYWLLLLFLGCAVGLKGFVPVRLLLECDSFAD